MDTQPALEKSSTPAIDRVPTLQLFAYGLGGLVPIALFNIAGQLMGLIGNISLGLSAFWLGVIMIVPRLWDAFSDPVVGHITDNTRSAWGRRRPFLLFGGIAVALSFVLMWWIPDSEWLASFFQSETVVQWVQLIYILVFLLIFFTACTVFEIPHGALGMELSRDYHERTRLFSAKSFFGNIFAMGTPWLFALANLEIFRGVSGNEADGMRFVSIGVALILVPLSFWWFFTIKEPVATLKTPRKESRFWDDIRTTAANRQFRILVITIFTLALGFNFVSLLGYYIPIFYVFEGDKIAASALLGINGTIWAVTGVLAVFPLNFISRRLGKKTSLIIAIALMCAAQLSKVFCYNPSYPYLIVIPTILLSTGMLFFFTLGAAMVGDICDEDDLRTAKRKEGTYYSVYWWFIKTGTALASLVTGVLILSTQFDQTQVKLVDELSGEIRSIYHQAKPSEETRSQDTGESLPYENVLTALQRASGASQSLQLHLTQTAAENHHGEAHFTRLMAANDYVGESLKQMHEELATSKLFDTTLPTVPLAYEHAHFETPLATLRLQMPRTLFIMRFIEIGLPIVLCLISLLVAWRYSLTEARCYEIKRLLSLRDSST